MSAIELKTHKIKTKSNQMNKRMVQLLCQSVLYGKCPVQDTGIVQGQVSMHHGITLYRHASTCLRQKQFLRQSLNQSSKRWQQHVSGQGTAYAYAV